MHRGAFCQFPFQWIYYYGSDKSTGKESGKTHLWAMLPFLKKMTSQKTVAYKLLPINYNKCL